MKWKLPAAEKAFIQAALALEVARTVVATRSGPLTPCKSLPVLSLQASWRNIHVSCHQAIRHSRPGHGVSCGLAGRPRHRALCACVSVGPGADRWPVLERAQPDHR